MNPNAAALLYILADDGRTSVPALADALDLHITATRRHLATLRAIGMVTSDLVGSHGCVGGATRYYTASEAGAAWAAREQAAA